MKKSFSVLMLACLLFLSACEDPNQWTCDFDNRSSYTADIYRNGTLQFSLAPGQAQECDIECEDKLEVRDHSTGRVTGSYRANIYGDIKSVDLHANIYNDEVRWGGTKWIGRRGSKGSPVRRLGSNLE